MAKQYENKSKSSEVIRDRYKPLDGGWAWMVVIGFAIIGCMCGGFLRVFTLIYREWLLRYKKSDFQTSIVFGIQNITNFLSGPIAGAVCNAFGHRRTAILGGLCCFIGFIISAFAPSLLILYLSFGVLTGIGVSLFLVSSFAIIPVYFQKKRGLAMAISTATTGLAALYPPLVIGCLNQYGYTGTMLIMGALYLHVCVSGALYRPIEDNFPKSSKSYETNITPDDYGRNGKSGSLEIQPKNHIITPLKIDMGSFQNIALEPMGSISNIPDELDKCRTPEQEEKTSGRKRTSLLKHCRCCLDISLLKNISFMLFCLSMSGTYFFIVTIGSYHSGLAEEKGFTTEDIKQLLIAMSICDAAARLLSGFLFDRPFVVRNMVTWHGGFSILSCIFVLITAYSRQKVVLFIASCCYAAFAAVHHTQHTNVLSDIVGKGELATAIGLMRFAVGCVLVPAPMIGGTLKDITGLYTASYLLAVSFSLLGAILFLGHHHVKKWCFHHDNYRPAHNT